MEKGGSRSVSEGLGGKDGEREPGLGLSVDEKSRAGPAVGGVRVGLLSISESVSTARVRTPTPTISYLLITFLKTACFLLFQGKTPWQCNGPELDSLSDFTTQALQSTLR